MPHSDAYFSGSPLSSVGPSPHKPITAGHEAFSMDNDRDASEGSAAGEVFEVEAIVARKGGYNGKTLLYKIRWVSSLARAGCKRTRVC